MYFGTDPDCHMCSVQYIVFVITGQEISVCGKCLGCNRFNMEELAATSIGQKIRQLWSQYNLNIRSSVTTNSIESNQELDELMPKEVFHDIQQGVPMFSGIQTNSYGGTPQIIAMKTEWKRLLQDITASKQCLFCQEAACTQLSCLRKLFSAILFVSIASSRKNKIVIINIQN